MALAGGGAVAIWHDIAPEGRAAFYAWHGSEHMPERVGIPGFLRGRRYVALRGTPEFFNLYETSTADVVKGADYLARLNAPTPWTVSTVRHFRKVARSLCEVAASAGVGQGGLVATFRYDVDDARAAVHRSRMARSVAEWAAEPGIAGCHLLVADAAASAVETAEKRARGEATEVPRWILLVESWDDTAPFIAWCERFAGGEAFADTAMPPSWSVYRLQNALEPLAPS
jgi:hypothetical protein